MSQDISLAQVFVCKAIDATKHAGVCSLCSFSVSSVKVLRCCLFCRRAVPPTAPLSQDPWSWQESLAAVNLSDTQSTDRAKADSILTLERRPSGRAGEALWLASPGNKGCSGGGIKPSASSDY